jgi:hypothetical protein
MTSHFPWLINENLKVRGRRYLARTRQSRSVRVLHRVASFIEDAYANEEWDMCVNVETALVERLAPARFSTLFDVGSNVGDWSVRALRAWPGSHVHTFEVARPTFDLLKQHVAAAGLSDRVTPNAAA